jgi:glutathione S-transferase
MNQYTLYGSQTSPFVRRTRILLEKIPYEFKEMDLFGKDAHALSQINPINQVPVLVHGTQKIWDSRVIFNYLNRIHHFQDMSWEDENLLTAIDGAMNSAVSLLLMKRSNIDIDGDFMYIKRQRERIDSILNYLKPLTQDSALEVWNIHTISLYCLLDWATFRHIIDLSHRPEYLAFLESYSCKDIVKTTQIPRT